MPRAGHCDESILLVGHGSRAATWFETMVACLDIVRIQLPAKRVEIAYLDHHPAEFRVVLGELVNESTLVTIVPLFMAPGGHLLADVRGHIESVIAMNSGVELRLLPTLTEFPEVREAFASAVAKAISP